MSEIKKINHRLVTCFQSSGRIGKSTVFEGVLAWAAFAGIPVGAVDCDAEHRTLSKRFPSTLFVDATKSKDEFLQLIMDLPDAPLAVADFPAQATDFLLTAMDSLRVLDALDANETRLTVLMFGADDPTATASMAKTYRALGDRADYLLVKNPARFRSQSFDQSALAELFKKNRVPVLELPALTATTVQAIETASAEKKKHLTYAEAAKLPSIHQMCRFEIEHFLNRIFTQCEDAARVLVSSCVLPHRQHRFAAMFAYLSKRTAYLQNGRGRKEITSGRYSFHHYHEFFGHNSQPAFSGSSQAGCSAYYL